MARQPINQPVMDAETAAKFRKEVTTLLTRAGWRTGRIATWAASAASGYGKYFTYDEALVQANAICREINKHNAALNRILRPLRKAIRSL